MEGSRERLCLRRLLDPSVAHASYGIPADFYRVVIVVDATAVVTVAVGVDVVGVIEVVVDGNVVVGTLERTRRSV